MSEIIDRATALGEAIRDSEEMKELMKKEIIYNNDDEAQRITGEYNEMRESLAKQAENENITPMEMLEIRKKLAAKLDEVSKQTVVAEYMAAKKAFQEILMQVDNIIRYYVTGEDAENEEGCSGSCESCKGCH
ncbi:MAG: YlbF family regulator [Bacillota bacterium]|nr:YlbF family regulator [Bacillota bacterium]